MVMVLSQDIPSDKEIYYRRSLIEATDKAGYQYATYQYGKRQYGPAPSELYNNRYHDNLYHGRTYGANLYPHLSRVTSAQQMQFVRKRMPHIMPTHQNASTSSPSWKQRIIRDQFKRCVECFNIQPYTGGAGPGEPGPKNRKHWYEIEKIHAAWYYTNFIGLTWKEIQRVGTPAWCKNYYLYIYTDPPFVTTSEDYDYITEPFTVHAEIWLIGIYKDTDTPYGCVHKQEGTQGWYKKNGQYVLETCCTNIKFECSLATDVSCVVHLQPRYIFQTQSGIHFPGGDCVVVVTNGTGSRSGFEYVDKDNNPITDQHILFPITGDYLGFLGNTLLLINPYFVQPSHYRIMESTSGNGVAHTYNGAWAAAIADLEEHSPESQWRNGQPTGLKNRAAVDRSSSWFVVNLGQNNMWTKYNLYVLPTPQSAYLIHKIQDSEGDIDLLGGNPLKCSTLNAQPSLAFDTYKILGNVSQYFGQPEVIFKFSDKTGIWDYSNYRPPAPPIDGHHIKGYSYGEGQIIWIPQPP